MVFKKGMIPWNKNKKLSDEIKKNLSESHKDYIPTIETKKKISETMKKKGIKPVKHKVWNKGLTKETDERIKKYSPKCGNGYRGKNYEEIFGIDKAKELKEIRRFARLGKKCSEETCIKIGLGHKGIKPAEERKKIISKQFRELWKKEEFRNKMKNRHTLEGNKKISLSNKGRIAWNKGIEHTKIKGEKNPNWKGGIMYEPYTKEFNNKSKNMIRKRDNQVCMNCGIHREKLRVALCIHHVDYNKLNSIEQNCISLCINCHASSNINRDYWKKLFQDKLNRLYDYKYSDSGEIIITINN